MAISKPEIATSTCGLLAMTLLLMRCQMLSFVFFVVKQLFASSIRTLMPAGTEPRTMMIVFARERSDCGNLMPRDRHVGLRPSRDASIG